MTLYKVIIPCADIKSKPDILSGTETQIVYGEIVVALADISPDFYEVELQQKHDNYHGFIHKTAVTQYIMPATHRVITKSSFLFHKPDIKSANPFCISLGSCVTIDDDIDDIFYRTITGHYVIKKHIMPMDSFLEFSANNWCCFLQDNFYHTPYLWGGRSSTGIDCSGLVQLSLQAFGIFLPRDSAPQEKFLSLSGDINHLTSADLIFWSGHVGVMINNTDFIHANAFHMKVIIEPISQVIERNPNHVSSVKRIVV